MWRWLAILAVLGGLAGPVAAQESGPRTLVDMTVWVLPMAEPSPPTCVVLPSGRVAVTAVQDSRDFFGNDGPPQPINFSLFGYRTGQEAGDLNAAVSPAESTLSMTVTGGLYCFWLRHQAPAAALATSAEVNRLSRFVYFRLTIAP